MAVQIPDPGTGNGQTGDNEYVFRKKVKDNFTDQTNAASRLLGTGAGQVPLAEDAFRAGFSRPYGAPPEAGMSVDNFPTGTRYFIDNRVYPSSISSGLGFFWGIKTEELSNGTRMQTAYSYQSSYLLVRSKVYLGGYSQWVLINRNTTVDGNGFVKAASPVVDLYNDKIEQNEDALKQSITFEKLGIGDYLIKGSLGFAQEGWYIETPKDANGNVLVAVFYEQLANNDISVKTYAKRFDDETGDIVPNLTRPRDIPEGRFISLRLHELPVMPTENQPEV